MRILIVDDSTFQRIHLKRIITALGHEPVEAGHGQAGLDMLATDPAIRVVLSDLLMPVMDGFTFAEKLLQRYPNLPIIICSADIQHASKERCQALGVTLFVSKPIDQGSIARALSSLGFA